MAGLTVPFLAQKETGISDHLRAIVTTRLVGVEKSYNVRISKKGFRKKKMK